MITRAKLGLRVTRVIIRIKKKKKKKKKNMDARATWTKLSLRVTRAIIKIKETKKAKTPIPNQKARSAGATRERYV